MPAMITKIHELKMLELPGPSHSGSKNGENSKLVENSRENLPYTLCGIAHSLGGAAILIYVVTQRLAKRPHYLSRLILLSPAGFHEDVPFAARLLLYVAPFVAFVLPGIYIPTRFFRALFNKLSRDFQNYPALGSLVQAILSYLIGGDSSNWVGAIGVSHYNMNNMPGVSVRVGVHLGQMMRSKRFIMYDYKSKELNLQAYGTPYPLDIGANYGVIDIPVDVVGGRRDRLIPPSMVRKHYDTMKNAGCQASYSEFEFAHLDFTFANREELMAYVASRLSLVAPIDGNIIEPLEETRSSRNVTGSLSRKSFGERRHGKSLNKDVRKHQNGAIQQNGTLDEVQDIDRVLSTPLSKLKST
jgi:pimeloyl-ACP methyl ester carboxylesterase